MFARLSLCIGLVAGLVGPVHGQDASEADYLAAVLSRPSDPEISFRYARAAAGNGNVRGAIVALERIVLMFPHLANIKLELGILYFRTGQDALAQRMIAEALEDPGAPEAVKARAREILAAAEKNQRRWSLSGYASAGVGVDSNANFGPDDGASTVRGTIDPSAAGQADLSFVGSGGFGLAYDLGTQAGHTAVLSAGFYSRRYVTLNDYDMDVVTGAAGLDFRLDRVFGGPSILQVRTDVIQLWRDYESYMTEIGPSVRLTLPAGARTALSLGAFAHYQDFHATSLVPANDIRDGAILGLSGEVSYRFTERTSGGFVVTGLRKQADAAFEAFGEVAAGVTGQHSFLSPFGQPQPWTLQANAAAALRTYDSPDSAIDPAETQEDVRLRLGLALNVPLGDRVYLTAQSGLESNMSNYDIDSYTNVFGLLLLSARF
ncbi:tetratricopeptide repeat protein [Acuticoccus yangtzensis]|uniref:tetratricopeptide repeat protein n=1 Tax=Acuticoccus yangtzensis TaxID=1443441 RepID=UPI00094980BF|nr:tetratricopeptide repeat protein [Acuticoccus yangtzensis]